MHDFTMPQWAIDRVMQRRGKLHVHDDMDPRRTALIVVDLQNGFMVPAYTPMPVKTSLGTVPNVNRLAATLREGGGKVFWIQNTTNEASLQEWGGFAYVLIVGTVTNVCCESSARDAMMLNFKTVMVSDGNSAHSDAEHTATLAAFYAVFGDVMDTDMTIACLRKNAARVAAAAE